MALPVLVAGAGPVGLTLACEPDRLGVECRIADAAADRACAGVGPPDAAMALAARFAPLVRARVLATGELPAAGPPGVEVLADGGLRTHGRLGATEETAFVVRPDGYLGFRCEPPDPARIAGHLGRLGVGAG